CPGWPLQLARFPCVPSRIRAAWAGGRVTRFQKVAAATVTTTFLLVVIGVLVRSTDSGVACPTWPGCFPGQFLPGLEAGPNVWLEWVHRTVAVIVGFVGV